ncbi:MAG: hypothetical protein A2Z34_03150 [Planctomycetes bacterium RBG_16_59_8]|nr:MAG: hypothetical protein A2Z34_03150 [Planctomycetes bacterium RBG_16_59_8]
MSTNRLILLAHDKSDKRDYYKNLLIEDERGYQVDTASCGEETVEKALKQEYCVIVLDVLMPESRTDEAAGRVNQTGGISALEQIRRREPWLPVIIFSQNELSDDLIDKARTLGIFDYIVRSHPHTDFKFLSRVRNAEDVYWDRRKALEENSPVIYRSALMEGVILHIRTVVAKTDTSVLILGETGVGKEMIANEIYRLSPRAGKPFLKINCAAMPETLLESELFGHELGAFTGAVSRRRGLLELADKGVLFLDEIGDMSPATQAKLLRAIEEQEIRPLGSEQTKKVDVRIVCATNKNLEALMRKEQFRDDLYYRICYDKIVIPPLRQRPEDIAPLVESFVGEFNRKYHKETTIDRKVIKRLKLYPLPGNVRELKSILFASLARLHRNESMLTENHLENRIFAAEAGGAPSDAQLLPEEKLKELIALGKIDLEALVGDLKEKCLRLAMAQCNHNAEKAAKLLKVRPHSFRRWLRSRRSL